VSLPRIPITSPAFRYTNSASTDLAKTFARERKRLLAEELAPKAMPKDLPPGFRSNRVPRAAK
jgi:hypothetical protein